jgi:ParB/RepB/Spo0J family partition protein
MEQYRLVAGERRFRAMAEVLEWKDVPAFIKEMKDALHERTVMAHENLGRVDLNPMEEAEVYREFTQDFELSEAETAERCGVTLARVVSRLKLLDLVPMARDLVAKGQLPISHAEEMTSLPDGLQHEALKLLGKTAVPFTMFKQYLTQLIESQTEQLGFDLTEFWMEQMESVQDEQAALRAREATIITNDDLPPVVADRKDTAGDIIVRYMRDLNEAGFGREAAAVGNLLDVLLKFRKVKNFREAGDLMEQGKLFQGGG